MRPSLPVKGLRRCSMISPRKGKFSRASQAGGAPKEKKTRDPRVRLWVTSRPTFSFPHDSSTIQVHEEPSSGSAPRWKLHTIRSRKLVGTYSARETKTQREEKCARSARSDRKFPWKFTRFREHGRSIHSRSSRSKGIADNRKKYAPCKFPGFPGCNIIAP